MRLDKIKIAGFKSFVDPTTVHITSNLTGVVGPNGCGKSNIIDAVRWVMGESSAKHLRGESMADVIFNGSSSRKPVGQATIELVFDNADGTLGGQYASFSEISIKRQVTRDGLSQYFLNGAKCRRRDVTDIFLGTGLGPRSYSIIEQGMISRLIEAKPEELRVFFEEAAGISKYKERRRETETRIRHTRENLDRLNDLRDEIDKQLQHLNRQAKTAEKYKTFKEDERQHKAELLAIRLRDLDKDAVIQQKAIHERETALEAAKAAQQSIETSMEKDREQHIDATDAFNQVQTRFYGLGSDIARDEQAIQHAREMRSKQTADLEQLENNWNEIRQHIDVDEKQIADLSSRLQQVNPQFEKTTVEAQKYQDSLSSADELMQQWQRDWDEFNQKASVPSEQAQVQRTRIEHVEKQIVQAQQRLQRTQTQLGEVSLDQFNAQISDLETREKDKTEAMGLSQGSLENTKEEIVQLRTRTQDGNHELNELRGRIQNQQGRLSSLEALQQAALGKADNKVMQWLSEHNLQDAPRLVQKLEVDEGWETAVETVMGLNLEAVCVDDFNSVADLMDRLDSGSVAFFDTRAGQGQTSATQQATRLSQYVRSPWPVDSLMAGVYAVASLHEAMSLRPQLKDFESVITRDGIWLGSSWVRLIKEHDEKSGVIGREQEIKTLKAETEKLQSEYDEKHATLEREKNRLREFEESRELLQQEVNQLHREQAQAQSQLGAMKSRLEQLTSRYKNLLAEKSEIEQHMDQDGESLKQARNLLNSSLESIDAFSRERETLISKRETLKEQLDYARQEARKYQDEVHQLNLQQQSMTGQLKSTEQNLSRMRAQVQVLEGQRKELSESLEGSLEPITEMEKRLEVLLSNRVEVEAELQQARKQLEDIDASMRKHEQDRHAAEQKVQDVRSELEQARMVWQEFNIRATTLKEQLDQSGYELKDLLETLDENATEQAWQEIVETLERKIQRLGPINLAAIDEFAEQTERKEYLDSQYVDITSALDTLENAIRKIDKETRTRFKETYDKVNSGLQRLFPRVFGGGHAYLELTGEDLLDSGVSVMARPPGKRNSSIHLLSGGEKALTAVALVFAIFELNPAPFCMLDEVDAPLDDANVGRFCELVKEMSDTVQFIFITHNKVTMAMSNQLSGVTMHEPGVSRMVAVDVDEAVKLAAM
jgi:chromosome segregation protein